MGLVKRTYQSGRAKLVRDMRSDNRWKIIGEELQEFDLTRRTPSEWWIFGYLMYRIMGAIRALTQRKPENDDEESKRDGGGKL